MLIGKRQADGLELLLLDDAAKAARRLFLLARPETVTFNEAQCVTSRVIPGRDEVANFDVRLHIRDPWHR